MFDRSAENEPYLEFLRTPKFDGEDCDVSGDEDDDSFSSEPEDDEDMGNSRVDSKSEGDNKNDDKDATVCSGQSIARLFMAGMMGDEEVLQYPDQVEQVASFYEKGSLGDDAETKASQNENVVALLDDRNICGTIHVNRGSCQCTGHCRPYLGPLTSEQLGKALEKKVAYRTSYGHIRVLKRLTVHSVSDLSRTKNSVLVWRVTLRGDRCKL